MYLMIRHPPLKLFALDLPFILCLRGFLPQLGAFPLLDDEYKVMNTFCEWLYLHRTSEVFVIINCVPLVAQLLSE